MTLGDVSGLSALLAELLGVVSQQFFHMITLHRLKARKIHELFVRLSSYLALVANCRFDEPQRSIEVVRWTAALGRPHLNDPDLPTRCCACSDFGREPILADAALLANVSRL